MQDWSSFPLPSAGKPAAALAMVALGAHPILLHGVSKGACTCSRTECGRSAGKHPMDAKWQTTELDAATLLARFEKRPELNLGWRMGVQPNGLRILAIDDDGGLAALQEQLGPLPATLQQKTGSGGHHRFYRVPLGIELTNRVKLAGVDVDVRCDGGQVVFAPSVTSAGRYSLTHRAPIAELPAAWLEAITQTTAEPAPAPEPVPTSDRLERARKYVATIEPAISGSGGHQVTFRVALKCREFALSEAEALAVMREYNTRCQPPWSERELKHKVDSAYSQGRVASGAKLGEERPPRRPARATLSPPPDDDFGPDPDSYDLDERLGQEPESTPPADLGGAQPKTNGVEAKVVERSAASTPADPPPPNEPTPILELGDHAELAKLLVLKLRAEGDVVHDEGEFYRYAAVEGRWEVKKFPELGRAIQSFSGRVQVLAEGQNGPKVKPLRISASDVRGVHMLASQLVDSPAWFDTRRDGIAFKNGFLTIERDGSSNLEPHSPAHRSRWGHAFDFRAAEATPAHWLDFLDSLWGDDWSCKDLLHEMLGYLLVSDTSLQKIFLLLGPPRSGKGTILRLIGRILGAAATSFKVNQLDDKFGLVCLLGKSVAIDGDVRRSTGKNKDEGAIVERLLGISGEDVQNIPRKFIDDVSVRLPTRLVLASNPPFGLRDTGATLSSRLVILPFERSFLGKEDPQLEAKLAAEIPGIVALAIEGLKRLRARGHFIEPQGAIEHREQITRTETPVLTFVRECCTIDKGHTIACDKLYAALREWSKREGHTPPSNTAFGDTLRQMGITKFRGIIDGKRLPRVYQGITLTDEAAEELREEPRQQSWHHY